MPNPDHSDPLRAVTPTRVKGDDPLRGTYNQELFNVIWDGSQWVAVGDKGVMAKGDSSGANWNAKRVTDLDTSWYTQVVKSGNRHYLSGNRLAVEENGNVSFFYKKI